MMIEPDLQSLITIFAMKSLVVVGGTGFVGRHICQAALKTGRWKVMSLSRHRPAEEHPQVQYIQADIFKPKSYEKAMESADAVVHSMGTIFPNTKYKELLSGPPSLNKLAQFATSCDSGNPLKKSHKNKSQYELLNRDSAIILAGQLAKLSPPPPRSRVPFVYISAEDWLPTLVTQLSPMSQYIASKREAEATISTLYSEELRSVFLRPGFMYDRDSHSFDIRSAIGGVMLSSNRFTTSWNDLFQSNSIPTTPQPLAVQALADAVVESIEDSTIEGAVSLEVLRRFEDLAY